MITTTAILTNIQYGVPSGPYDGFSQDWVSEPVQAADYYRGRGNLQTLLLGVTNFEGDIIVEATLDTVPDSVDTKWFDTYTLGEGVEFPLTIQQVANIAGNFTWMRLRITGFVAGTINSVTITY